MNNDKIINNWVDEMIDYYNLETTEALTGEEFNSLLVELSFNSETTPEWVGLCLDAMEDYYSLSDKHEVYTPEIYNEELRRVFVMQETVIEMPFTSKHALAAAMNY